MKFYTAYNRPKTKESPAGTKEESVYNIEIDLTGHKKIVEVGKTNIYDIIQESLEQSKIENIIRRATEGDIMALQMMNGDYIDTTDVPKTLAEAQNFVIKAKQEFDQLPINIRRQFNMSAEQYIAEYGTGGWIEKLGILHKENESSNTDPINNTKENSTKPTNNDGGKTE